MSFHPLDVEYATQRSERAMRHVRSQPRTPHLAPLTVLCLHPGNLPFAGWHDVLAVAASGHRYAGKLSRKDPGLEGVIDLQFGGHADPQDLAYHHAHGFPLTSTSLADFRGLRADKVMFSGSKESVPNVLHLLHLLDAVHEKTTFLIRTAHTSMAWVDSLDHNTMQDLAEGIARYDGQGCRSVRYVYSPFAFSEAKSALLAASQGFSDRELFPRNVYRAAYIDSIGQDVIQVGKLLVSDTDPLWDDDDVVVWKQKSRDEMMRHAQELGNGLQQMYHTSEIITGGRWEPLSQAQTPPLDWKPDGVDVVEWLLT